jgi:hypothetical protein
MDNKIYHIYAKNNCLYHNLEKKDFEEKWQLLNVMVGLLKTDYSEGDLSYIELVTKVGAGGQSTHNPAGRVIHKQEWEEDSY